MSADDEEHSESEFYYSTEDITLPIALIETTFYLGKYEFMRGDLKKIKYYLPVWSVRIEKYFSRS
jgi:lipoprotein NlpI